MLLFVWYLTLVNEIITEIFEITPEYGWAFFDPMAWSLHLVLFLLKSARSFLSKLLMITYVDEP